MICVSCNYYKIPGDVFVTVELTKNKGQLFKTLNHYNNQKDSLKFKAACFLIKNMLNKGYKTGKKIEQLDNFFDMISTKQKNGKKLTEKEIEFIWDSISANCSNEINFMHDIDEIKYKHLKATIDQSFSVWQNMPYSKNVPFDYFLNYILPYRIAAEALEENKAWLAEKYKWIADSLKDRNNPVEACTLINNELRKNFFYFFKLDNYPGNISISNLYKSWVGVCDDMSNIAVVSMRSVGIAVTKDYTPQFGNIKKGHSWNVVFDKNLKAVPFMGCESNPYKKSQYQESVKPAKIFRKTFGLHQTGIVDIDENIPEQFKTIDYIDVTEEYIPVTDVTLKLKNILPKTSYAYLCIFNNERWNPIFWGKMEDGKVTFKKMGRDIVYLPVYCLNYTHRIADEPFLLTKGGEVKKFKISSEVYPSMQLTRKYPLFPRIQRFIERMKGGRVQGANISDFSDAVDLFVIHNPEPYISEVSITNHNKFKYVRYIGPADGYSDISELEFYGRDNSGKIKKLEGKIIGKGENFLVYKEAFDNNWESYFFSSKPGLKEWVGLSFGKPQSICKIRYLPRTDDNAVREGDTYELFFWANGWISFGKEEAKDKFLIFNYVPKNTLYWLRNCTRGKEERIFTYENGQQIWW